MNEWWQNAVVYQIYPLSFKDSDGNGKGDIPGIISKLDYIKELGADVIWLSPVYASPMDDNGYDISDYRAINPLFGTMDDMDRLIAEAKARGLKIMMDLVINHTSDEHEWFVKSRDKNSPYRDYYFWREGKGGKEPNNWGGFFGGKVWEKDERSGEYYLHLFSEKQPDLNYKNPKVLEEIENIMRFWLDKGIAGFRCDVINIIWKKTLQNGKPAMALCGSEHYLTNEGTHNILHALHEDVLKNYDCFTVGETVFVDTAQANELTSAQRGELSMVFQFEQQNADQVFVKWFRKKFKPKQFFETIAKWQTEVPWNANYLENHDQPRSVSRYCSDESYRDMCAKMLAVMLFTLRGTPYIYQGEELGMRNFDFTLMDDIRDVESENIYALAKKLHIPEGYRKRMIREVSRDNARTPMQWNGRRNAGFSEGEAWIKVNGNHTTINAEAELSDENSVLNFYKEMIALRKTSPVLREGSFRKIHISNTAFVYERELDGEKLMVALNFSGKTVKVNVTGETVISNYGGKKFDGELKPWQGVIIK